MRNAISEYTSLKQFIQIKRKKVLQFQKRARAAHTSNTMNQTFNLIDMITLKSQINEYLTWRFETSEPFIVWQNQKKNKQHTYFHRMKQKSQEINNSNSLFPNKDKWMSVLCSEWKIFVDFFFIRSSFRQKITDIQLCLHTKPNKAARIKFLLNLLKYNSKHSTIFRTKRFFSTQLFFFVFYFSLLLLLLLFFLHQCYIASAVFSRSVFVLVVYIDI